MRLLIFSDLNTETSSRLIEATLRLARTRSDVAVAGIVTSRPAAFRRPRTAEIKRCGRAALATAANGGASFRTFFPHRVDLDRVIGRRGIPILTPEDGDPNSPSFVARIVDELRPSVAVSYFSMSIFRRSLLDAFEHAINYHDGLLPRYRGLRSTSLSIYHGEAVSGFTFHRMSEGIDAGPILTQESIAIDEHATLDETVRQKACLAVAALPRVLDLIDANAPGRPQAGPQSYFSDQDSRAIYRIAHPEELTADELHRRMRAFGTLLITIEGTTYPVTRLARAPAGRALGFRTADGISLVPNRFHGLPRALSRIPSRTRGDDPRPSTDA